MYSSPDSFLSAIVARTPGLNTSAPPPGIVSSPASRNAIERVANGHLLDARDVRDLDGGERLDVNLRDGAPSARETSRCSTRAPRAYRARRRCGTRASACCSRVCRFGVDLLHRVAVRAVFFRQPRVRAEDAGLPQDADVRRIDVLVRGERDAVAVLRAIDRVGHVAEADQVGAGEQRDAVFRRQPLAALDLVGDRAESAGSLISATIERTGEGTASTPRSA